MVEVRFRNYNRKEIKQDFTTLATKQMLNFDHYSYY